MAPGARQGSRGLHDRCVKDRPIWVQLLPTITLALGVVLGGPSSARIRAIAVRALVTQGLVQVYGHLENA